MAGAVAVVDKNVGKKGTRKVAEAYLNFLYSPEGQDIAAAQEKQRGMKGFALTHIPLAALCGPLFMRAVAPLA